MVELINITVYPNFVSKFEYCIIFKAELIATITRIIQVYPPQQKGVFQVDSANDLRIEKQPFNERDCIEPVG